MLPHRPIGTLDYTRPNILALWDLNSSENSKTCKMTFWFWALPKQQISLQNGVEELYKYASILTQNNAKRAYVNKVKLQLQLGNWYQKSNAHDQYFTL